MPPMFFLDMTTQIQQGTIPKTNVIACKMKVSNVCHQVPCTWNLAKEQTKLQLLYLCHIFTKPIQFIENVWVAWLLIKKNISFTWMLCLNLDFPWPLDPDFNWMWSFQVSKIFLNNNLLCSPLKNRLKNFVKTIHRFRIQDWWLTCDKPVLCCCFLLFRFTLITGQVLKIKFYVYHLPE